MESPDALNNKSTDKLIALLNDNRQSLLKTWVENVRDSFGQTHTLSDSQLADHMLYIIDAVIDELKRFGNSSNDLQTLLQDAPLHNEGTVQDTKGGGESHGLQRAGINAYNVDKVYWEYVLLRRTIIDFVQQHHLLDLNHIEVITSVIESCSRESLLVFTKTLQKVQTKILSSVVHDIRSPLHVLSMVSELVGMATSEQQKSEYSKKMVSYTERINNMLEEMLLTLSSEAGQGLELSFKEVVLHEFLTRFCEESKPIYGNMLRLKLPEKQLTAVLDELIFKRVFENLVSNAYKYGDKEKEVTIEVSNKSSQISIHVHNHGEPIPKDRLANIFDFLQKYQRVESPPKKSWGIGLAFVRAAVEGHGGTIAVTSDEQAGTRFTIEFPQAEFHQGQTVTAPF